MAKRGRKVTFHGAFGTKEAAKAKERKVGGFVKRTKVRGQTRYVVMSEKRG